MGDHFERVDNDDSYSSDFSNSEQVDIEAKMALMKEQSGKGNNKLTGYICFKIIAGCFLLILILTSILNYQVFMKKTHE